jgi:hypothetical protein
MTALDRQAEAPGVHPLAPEITADLSRVSLMVASPMYGGLCHDAFLLGMLDLRQACDARGIPLHVLTIRNESLVQRGRNTCVAHFLASDATHLLFIDSDIGFSAGGALRLLAHRKDVVGATYAKKSLGEPDFAILPLARSGGAGWRPGRGAFPADRLPAAEPRRHSTHGGRLWRGHALPRPCQRGRGRLGR